MSKVLNTPLNQQRQTNIAIVRMRVQGKKFEIACYKNKVVSWRNKIEKDLDEVMQTVRVFTNVSKGEYAKKEDLIQCFGSDDQIKVCTHILDHGELQISNKEREVMFEQLFKDIATIVANKCIYPETNRPYTTSMIERTMKNIHFVVHPSKSAKKQALEVIRAMKKNGIAIERAQMRLKLILPSHAVQQMVQRIEETEGKIEKTDTKEKSTTLQVLIEPGLFREVDEYINKHQAQYDIIDPCVVDLGEKNIDNIELKSGSSGATPNESGNVSQDEHSEEENDHNSHQKQKKSKPAKKKVESEEEDDEDNNSDDEIKVKKSKKKQNKKHHIESNDEEIQQKMEDLQVHDNQENDEDTQRKNKKSNKEAATADDSASKTTSKSKNKKKTVWDEQEEEFKQRNANFSNVIVLGEEGYDDVLNDKFEEEMPSQKTSKNKKKK